MSTYEDPLNPWQQARRLHISESHPEVFMVDCDHYRCILAYAWYWHQERTSQAEACQHQGRKRAMLRQLQKPW